MQIWERPTELLPPRWTQAASPNPWSLSQHPDTLIFQVFSWTSSFFHYTDSYPSYEFNCSFIPHNWLFTSRKYPIGIYVNKLTIVQYLRLIYYFYEFFIKQS